MRSSNFIFTSYRENEAHTSIAGYPETKSSRQKMQEKLLPSHDHTYSVKAIGVWGFEEDEKNKELKIVPAEPLQDGLHIGLN